MTTDQSPRAGVVDFAAARAARELPPVPPPPPPPTLVADIVDPAPAASRVPTRAPRPILPEWASDKATISATARWGAKYAGHVTLFHLIRLPLYGARIAARSPIGVGRIVAASWRWLFNLENRDVRLRALAAAAAEPKIYAKLEADQRGQMKSRLIALAVILAGLALTTAAVVHLLPVGWRAVLVLALVLLLGVIGRKADTRVMGRAAETASVPPLTADLITNALATLGLATINAALKTDPRAIRFQAIVRDGPGFRADVDLPAGVTATEVIDRRSKLASGLRRPLGCVWPEAAPEIHEGRLVLYVADRAFADATQPPWPLAKTGQVNIFQPIPLGTDHRGRAVNVTLMYASGIIGAIPRMGKALALDTPVPTPSGWSTMGELQDGDELFDETGAVCRVVEAHEIRHDRQCYEVVFSDGSVIVADAEHLWQVETRSSRANGGSEKVLTTAEMLGNLRVEKDSRLNYSVRAAGALQTPAADLPVPPYTLGAWLGDGTTANGSVTVGRGDEATIEAIRADGYSVRQRPSTTAAGSAPMYGVLGLAAHLRAAGVLGDKHIPAIYFRASEEQRRSLLAGLLDTDGWCEKWGSVRFVSTRQRLAEDVRRLVATLGYVSTMRSRDAKLNGVKYGTAWEVTFCPDRPVFRMGRKIERQSTKNRASNRRRFITEIRPVESVPVRCITVDSPSSLYLAGEQCIPTHNTFTLRLLLLAASLDPRVEIHAYNLKGGADLDPLEPVAHAYRSGDDPEDMEFMRRDLRTMQQEMRRRYQTIRELPKARCPESKVTDDLASDASLRLHPIIVAFDETQVMFEHPELGAEFETLVTDLVKRGPAVGIMVWLATQRPDAKSIPTGISSNAVLRVCLMVMGQIENDMVLGTSMYKAGVRATLFTRNDLGLAYLVGEGIAPVIVQTAKIDATAAEAVVERAHAARAAAGRLTGVAAGEEDADTDRGTVLDHLLAVWPADDPEWTAGKMWCEELATRLVAARPATYGGWTAERITAALKPHGISTVQVKRQGTNRRGIARADLVAATSPATSG